MVVARGRGRWKVVGGGRGWPRLVGKLARKDLDTQLHKARKSIVWGLFERP